MEAKDLLTLGLGLVEPWAVVGQELNVDAIPSELRLRIEAQRGSLFPCPECKKLCNAHDFKELTWRHLNFFQHHCLITARVPRVDCPEHGVHRIDVPWARPGSGFTLLFEQVVMLLSREMPVNTVAKHVGVTDKRIWRVVEHYVHRAMEQLDLGGLQGLGLDETARKRGHKYVTVFVDMERSVRPVIFATPGKGRACVNAFAKFLRKHKGDPGEIREVVCDMAPFFLPSVEETFRNAAVTVDWFHVVQLFNRSVEAVRRLESKQCRLPKGTRWAVLKASETKRTVAQEAALRELEEGGRATSIAFRVKELLRWVRLAESKQAAKWRATRFINRAQELVDEAVTGLLKPVLTSLQTFQEHLPRIVNRWNSKMSNARLEGMNSLFQAARTRARGYRNAATFITIIYLIGAPIQEILTT